MTETEQEPQFTTLAQRIAALNQQKNWDKDDTTQPRPPAKRRPPSPPPPGRPAAESRTQSMPVIPTSNGSPSLPPRPTRHASLAIPEADTDSESDAGERPPLPARTPSGLSPCLPPRRQTSSSRLQRRNSGSSEISQHSTISSVSIGYPASSVTSQGSIGPSHKLPPAFNPSSLPALPPTKREREAKEAAEASQRAAQIRVPQAERTRPVNQTTYANEAVSASRPSLPPRLPSRPAKSQPAVPTIATARATPPPVPAPTPMAAEPAPHRKLPPRKIQGFGSSTTGKPTSKKADLDVPPPLPRGRPSQSDNAPPPVPMASRPSAAQINSVNDRGSAAPPAVAPGQDCWVCRDWSGPDGVAAQYPKESLPRNDPIGYLAHHLCSPFPSYTDKARAMFSWFHHNITYDVDAFFNKTMKNRSPEDTLFYGKAVCGGYADAYTAIARRAGLECETVGGHGKGFGYKALEPGERPPPADPSGHAWNAVRIDGGKWHLIDVCWGAGNVTKSQQYNQVFAPEHFIKSNDDFGLRHFPQESRFQLRDDGRIVSWDEYYIGKEAFDPVTFYSHGHEEGIAQHSVMPKEKTIAVNSGEIVRFQFSKICEHWTSEKDGLGKPPLLLLSIHGVDGRKEAMVPIETDGYWHWADVNARDLGTPGQPVQVVMITTMADKDARGATAQEYFAKKGRVGMSWTYVMRWELV